MAKEIKTQIVIKANPEKVWAVLTNFEKYPEWNPFIKSLKGSVKIGSKIIVRLEPPEAKGMTFKPKVLAFDSQKEFVGWDIYCFQVYLMVSINSN